MRKHNQEERARGTYYRCAGAQKRTANRTDTTNYGGILSARHTSTVRDRTAQKHQTYLTQAQSTKNVKRRNLRLNMQSKFCAYSR